jgi:ATP-dependent exoDNAse (exonuclease V) beta subunit
MIAERISDQRQREAALDVRRSFIVQAPAGSGKTELLVQRYLRLLGAVQKPEEILAITFTIKAAAEMRERVLRKIDDPGAIAHRLRIQTIDAFCASLVRQMPVTSKFGAQPAVVEDASQHYREAAMRTLEELTPAAGKVLLHLDNNMDAAADLIASMLARRDQWLRKTGSAPTRSQLESALRSERDRLLRQARSLHPKASPEFAEAMLTREGTWRRREPEAQALSDNEPLRVALLQLRKLPPERYTDEQWDVLGAMLELLPRAAARLKVVFGERGETDFTEIAQGAVRALGTAEEPTDLLLALDTRIRHILVDEFQDTSVSQFELLEKLTAGWEPGDGRTLFLVGDPMQSIYRFREAEVALFLDAWGEGLGSVALERLTLTTNFRSQPKLVEWFNASFKEILPPAAERSIGAVPYSAATPHPGKHALPGEPVLWHHVANRLAESRRIVELVKRAAVSESSRTAILVRKRDALADIVPALKAAGIRYRAIEIERLGEKQVVQDLYALTRALTHLGDRIAWLAILRAPWLALPLERLLEISGRDRFKTIWELIKDDLFLSQFTSILAPAIENRSRGSLRDRVEGVWLALGGPACVADKTDLEDAEIYLDELERLESAGIVPDFAALAESLDKLYALPDVEATDDDLQIMTIHKAKGLEFDTVIVPGLDRGPGRSDPPLFLWKEMVAFEDSNSLLLAPMRSTGGERDPTYDYLRDLDSDAEDMEASRLLYVAATRAKSRLHLLACLECNADGELKKPIAHSLLERAWPVAAPFFSAPQRAPARQAPATQAIFTISRLARDFRRPALPAPATPAASSERREEERIEFSWAGETARHVGTVVHRWLQRIAEDELRGWDAKRVDALAQSFGRELRRRGVPTSSIDAAAQLVATALKNTLADDRGRWVLGAHPESRTEHRLRLRTNEGLRTFVMDRVLRDAHGEQWIVDFKTSRHEGTGVERFLDEERKRYEPQLNAYASAFGSARLGLYFPLLKGWREWRK